MTRLPFLDKINSLNSVNLRFIRLTVLLMIVVVIFVLLLTSILYSVSRDALIRQLYRNELDSTVPMNSIIKYMSDSVNSLALQLLRDEDIRMILYNQSWEHTSEQLKKVYRRLSDARVSMSFIDSIYLINLDAQSVILPSAQHYSAFSIHTENFPDQEIISILSSNDHATSYVPIPRIIGSNRITGASASEKEVFTYIYSELPLSKKRLNTSIVINTSKMWLDNYLQEQAAGAQMLVLNAESMVIFSSIHNSEYTFMQSADDALLLQQTNILDIQSDKNDAGFFTLKRDDDEYLVVYSNYRWVNWSIIKIIPLKSIISDLNLITRTTVSTCIVVLLLLILAFIFYFTSVGDVIRRMSKKMGQLENQHEMESDALRKDFLRSLLYDKGWDKQAVFDKSEELRININTRQHYNIVLIAFGKSNTHTLNNEEREFIYNLLKTKLKDSGSCGVFFDTNDCVILYNVEEDSLSRYKEDELERFSGMLRDIVPKEFLQHLTITIGIPSGDYSAVYEMYNYIRSSIKYNIFIDEGRNLYCDEVQMLEHKIGAYPSKSEQKLLDALLNQQIERTRDIYSKFIDALCDNAYDIFMSYLAHFVFELTHVIKTVLNGKGIAATEKEKFEYYVIWECIASCERVSQINTLINELFDEFWSVMINAHNDKSKKLHQQIVAFIKENCHDPSFSITTISDAFKMSPAYLGMKFNQFTSRHLVNYINDTRIENAKIVLAQTSLPIKAVAEKTGFSSTQYFHKVFKNALGITPNEFRNTANKPSK